MAAHVWFSAYSCGRLYDRAVAAFERTKPSDDEQTATEPDALDAIIFAAVSLEGFLNELPAAITDAGSRGRKVVEDLWKPWSRFAGILEEAERSHAAPMFKLALTCNLLHPSAVNKGASPYQDVALLFDVRDALVHVRPDYVELHQDGTATRAHQRTAKILESLRGKRVLGKPETAPNKTKMQRTFIRALGHDLQLSHIESLCTRAAARWACNSASAMVRYVLEKAPDLPNDQARTTVSNFSRSFRDLAPGQKP